MFLSFALACSTTPPGPPPCPPDAIVGALHDAAFHLEHGEDAPAAEERREARAWNDRHHHRTVEQLLAGLEEAAAAEDPTDRVTRTEELRMALTDWACLTEPLHEDRHRQLPPLTAPSR